MIPKYLNQSSGFGENKTQQKEINDVFFASTVLEEFALEYARYHLNRTANHMLLKDEHIGEYIKQII